MKQYSHRSRRSSGQRALAVMISIAVNVLLSYLCHRTGVPVYMDTIGTIGIATVGGLFPGIVTAILTNILCNTFNSAAIYFGGVNAMIAIFAAWYMCSFISSLLVFIYASCIRRRAWAAVKVSAPSVFSYRSCIFQGGRPCAHCWWCYWCATFGTQKPFSLVVQPPYGLPFM